MHVLQEVVSTTDTNIYYLLLQVVQVFRNAKLLVEDRLIHKELVLDP